MTISSAVVVQLQEEEEMKDAIMRNEGIDDDGNKNGDDDDEERGSDGDYFSTSFPKTFKTTNTTRMNSTVNGSENENDNKDDNGNDDYIINSQGNIVHDHHKHNDGSATKTKMKQTKTKKNKYNKKYRKRKCCFHILPKSIRNRIINFIDRWPRLIAIITRNLLMYSLIIVTLIGGYIMSIFEGPIEIYQNDLFLQKTWILKSLPVQETTAALVGLPTTCFLQYINLLQQQDTNIIELNSNSNSNNSISNNNFYTDPQQMFDLGNFPTKTGSSSSLSSYITDANVTWKGLYTAANNNNTLFPNINIGNSNGNIGGIDGIDFDFILDPSLLTLATLLPPKTETENETTSSTTDLEDDSKRNTTTTSSFEDSSSSSSLELFIEGFYNYMESCEETAGVLLSAVVNATRDVALNDFKLLIHDNKGGNGGLTFNWIRCWNITDTELGISIPFKPSEKQVSASIYINQTKYFIAEWENNRKELYENYTIEYDCANNKYDNENDNLTVLNRTKCYWEATKQSVLSASGSHGCHANTGSSAWFWFTIMTTVGYGNFSPNTQAGYVLVYCLGWISIIAFGILSIVAGYTYTTIADDIFRRLNMKWLHKPEYSVPLWAVLSLLWINLIAWNARSYWKSRVPEYDYTVGDSYWFSYISIFTVGLGDVFLQPQGMFISDVFRWTALFLNGFVFISAFLGKFGDLLIKYFPSRGESLEYHLARTDLWGIGKNIQVSKTLEILKQLVKTEENFDGEESSRSHKFSYKSSFVRNENANTLDERDGNTLNYHRIRILLEKKNLLIKLLEDAQSELEDRVDESLLDGHQNNNNNNDIDDDKNENGTIAISAGGDRSRMFNDPLALHHASKSLTTVEELQYEEHVLESTLLRTKEIRTQLEDYNRMMGGYKAGNTNSSDVTT